MNILTNKSTPAALLPGRCYYNALKRSGIEKIGQLDGISKKDFHKMRNIGKKAADELIDIIKSFGLEAKEQ